MRPPFLFITLIFSYSHSRTCAAKLRVSVDFVHNGELHFALHALYRDIFEMRHTGGGGF